MRKILTTLMGMMMAFALSSCFESETEITLKKDGSGTITEETVFGEQMMGMIEMAAVNGGGQKNPLAELKDEAKAKEKAKNYGEGVTLDKIEEVKRNGGKGVRITYQFTDINKITFNPGGALGEMNSDPKAADAAKGKVAKFQYADGKLTVILPQDDKTGEGEDEGGGTDLDTNNPETAMMMEMMRGMKVSAKLTALPEIAETNATHREGNTVTLFEMDFDKIMENPEGLKSLQKLDMKDRSKAAAALAKVKGVKAETREKLTLTIK